jgi:hypothetical protein
MAEQMSIYDAIKKNYEDAARRATEAARGLESRIRDFDLDDITQTARRADTTDPDLRTRGARAAQAQRVSDRRGASDVAERARRPSPEGMGVEARNRQARGLPIGTQSDFVGEFTDDVTAGPERTRTSTAVRATTDPDMTVEATGRTQPASRFTDTTDLARTDPAMSGVSGSEAPNVRRDLEATIGDRTARDVNRPMPRQQPGSDVPVGTGPRGREVEFTNLDDVTKTDVTVRDPGVSSRARQAAYKADLDGTFSKLAKELPKFDSAAKAKNFVKGMGAVGAVASLALIGDTIRRIKAGEEDPGVLMDILDPLFLAPTATATGERETAEIAEFLQQRAEADPDNLEFKTTDEDIVMGTPVKRTVGPTTTGQRRTAFPMAPRNDLLAVGARGSQVRGLNEDLQNLGLIKGGFTDVDRYTPQTRAAVMKLQDEAGIAVDGIVGPDTRKALQKAMTDPDRPLASDPKPAPAPARELTAREEAIQEGELTKARTNKAVDVFEEELVEDLGGEPMEDLDLKVGKIQMRQAGR